MRTVTAQQSPAPPARAHAMRPGGGACEPRHVVQQPHDRAQPSHRARVASIATTNKLRQRRGTAGLGGGGGRRGQGEDGLRQELLRLQLRPGVCLQVSVPARACAAPVPTAAGNTRAMTHTARTHRGALLLPARASRAGRARSCECFRQSRRGGEGRSAATAAGVRARAGVLAGSLFSPDAASGRAALPPARAGAKARWDSRTSSRASGVALRCAKLLST